MREKERTIGEIVAEDYRTAKVFQKYDMDFCCGGDVALSTACGERGIELPRVIEELSEAKEGTIERNQNYSAWALSFLIDYIVNVHHSYVKENTGQLRDYTHKIAEVHGARHPELQEIASLFDGIATELLNHLKEEEEDFFPAVKRMEECQKAGTAPAPADRESIETALDRLVQDHEAVGDAIHKIHSLAGGFAIPDDACNTYTVTYQKLKEFEDDLHKHVHLENNILFPKVARLHSQ